jgi:hypothetical protein
MTEISLENITVTLAIEDRGVQEALSKSMGGKK